MARRRKKKRFGKRKMIMKKTRSNAIFKKRYPRMIT